MQESTLHLVLRLRGGGDGREEPADSTVALQIQSSGEYLVFQDVFSLVSLKGRIHRRTGIPPEQQTLSCDGVELFDCK